jgi:hypothetical protein
MRKRREREMGWAAGGGEKGQERGEVRVRWLEFLFLKPFSFFYKSVSKNTCKIQNRNRQRLNFKLFENIYFVLF